MIDVLAQVAATDSHGWLEGLKLFLDCVSPLACVGLFIVQRRHGRDATETQKTNVEQIANDAQDMRTMREDITNLREDVAGIKAVQAINSGTLGRLEKTISRHFNWK